MMLSLKCCEAKDDVRRNANQPDEYRKQDYTVSPLFFSHFSTLFDSLYWGIER